MAYTKGKNNFENNKPVYTTEKTSVLPIESSLIPNISSKYSIDGEIVELQKRHYGTKDASQLLDRSFSELTKTRDGISPTNFFNLYRELFYDIPKIGENSHTTLMLESKEYINDYVDPNENKIQELLERIIELETEKTKFPTEHPVYRNGLFLRRQKVGGPLGLMQEGRLRLIVNNVYKTLKKPLGYVNQKGKILPDKDVQIVIGDATWNELPKWPDEAKITEENPNLNASLSDFLTPTQLGSDLNSLINVSSLIQTSDLTKEDINALMVQLKNKIPTANYGIEGNFDGTFQWDTEDLLPFNTKGNAQGQVKLLKISDNSDTTIVDQISILFNDFANRIATVGLGINSPDFVYIMLNSEQIIDDEFANNTEKQQAKEFVSSKTQLISGLLNLSNAVTTNVGFKQYRWDVDPDKFDNDNNSKFYWVQEAIDQEIEIPKIFAARDQISNNDFVYKP